MVNAAVPGQWLHSKGWLYTWGTPCWDAAAQVIMVNGFDFHMATKSRLAKMADWLLHDQVRERIQASLLWATKDLLAKAQASANKTLALCTLAEGVILSASLTEIGVDAMALENDNLALAVSYHGDASIQCEKLKLEKLKALTGAKVTAP